MFLSQPSAAHSRLHFPLAFTLDGSDEVFMRLLLHGIVVFTQGLCHTGLNVSL